MNIIGHFQDHEQLLALAYNTEKHNISYIFLKVFVIFVPGKGVTKIQSWFSSYFLLWITIYVSGQF